MAHRFALAIAVLTCFTSYTSAQFGGFCPRSYQTSQNFTVDYINQMIKAKEGYIQILSNKDFQACQILNLTSATDYTYSYITDSNEPLNYSNTFSVIPWDVATVAQLRLGTLGGLFGSGPLTHETLFPIIVRDDVAVFMVCTSGLITRSEKVMVFVPYPYTGSPSLTEIRDLLIDYRIPYVSVLRELSRNCTVKKRDNITPAGQPGVNQPFNIMNLFSNPFGLSNIFPNGIPDPLLSATLPAGSPVLSNVAVSSSAVPVVASSAVPVVTSSAVPEASSTGTIRDPPSSVLDDANVQDNEVAVEDATNSSGVARDIDSPADASETEDILAKYEEYIKDQKPIDVDF